MIKEYLSLFLKGLAMGVANVIPGVSGGTIAFITGIFERLINAIKSINLQALKLFFTGKWKAFAKHIDLYFLIAVLSGVAVAVVSVAKLFKILFENYPVYIWSFFLGLILASIYFVGKTISKWDFKVIVSFLIGTALAVVIAFTKPASENANFFYLIICGIIAACSMILPGLSGSFVLILLGNYQLVMINAVTEFNAGILLPVVIGAGLGLIGFSYFLSWVFKTFRNQTIAILTGFILGSLAIIYPWKHPINELLGNKIKTIGYNWYIPQIYTEFFIAVFFILLGAGVLTAIELHANRQQKN